MEARTGFVDDPLSSAPRIPSQEANMLMGGIGEKILITYLIAFGILIYFSQ